ncbi:FAD-binding domain-containing protein [Hygrophoropsis aurantiaca]|uniref:FAD-binding domain-containing protein n=1 Tax=Hygrophoropsis aurantiaca TaxID=72124 RepID=A0ACB7ZU44_9AGAM|nr:FAD-binding domain-containing protein [Hygrophoropsis aurantiaca]
MLSTLLSPLVAFTLLSNLVSNVAADVDVASLLLNKTCVQIADATSSASEVYYLGSLHYDIDITHWASSSTQLSACSFEPATPEDVGIALQILGTTRTPFAVKGGGHASNPGFSSTPGVHIAMSKFSEIKYDASSQTVEIGSGLLWDDVYAALEPHGVNVVGGRVTGVGVAGFILGGGYSWLTNQYGLTVDTVTAFELVMPNGTVTEVTETSQPELFFGLRGGFNNFGIVTKFTLKTFPQGKVWGGLITFTENNIPAVNYATANFAANNIDPKASIITTYNFFLGQPGVSQLIFYDGPNPPPGIFDDFLSIPYFTKDISTRSFPSLVDSSPANATAGARTIFNTVSISDISTNLIDAIVNETIFWGSRLQLETGVFISYDVEPFLPTIFNHGSSPSAYPPSRDKGFLPLELYYAWALETADDLFHDTIRTTAAHLKSIAIGEGQEIEDAAVYGNYAIYDTPLANIYGSNVPRLQSLKAAVDPTNVMGLAGGFRF